MSINILLLKKTMKVSYIHFQEYFQLIFSQVENLNHLWKNPEDEALCKWIKNDEKKVNDFYIKNSQEIEWNISQHQPTASNLRFFLTVLISLKDLERCGDYVYSLSKIIFKNKEIIKCFFNEKNICGDLQNKIKKMWDIFSEKKGKLSKKDFAAIQNIKIEFHQEFKVIFQDVNLSLLKHLTTCIDEYQNINLDKPIVSDIYLFLIKIDRLIDHIFNIAENFFLINYPHSDEEERTNN